MQFFPERVVEVLKKWAPPRQVTFKCRPPPSPGRSSQVIGYEAVESKTTISEYRKKERFQLSFVLAVTCVLANSHELVGLFATVLFICRQTFSACEREADSSQ